MGVRPGGIVALPVVALLVLGACGGSSEPLTTQEYAVRLEQAHADLQEQLLENVEAYEDFPEHIEERLDALGSPLSAEDAEAMKELVDTVLQTQVNILEATFIAFEDYHREVAGLRPPKHLSDLHNARTARLQQLLKVGDRIVAEMQKRAEGTEKEEDNNEALVDEVQSASSHADEACQELRAALEEELGRDVASCD